MLQAISEILFGLALALSFAACAYVLVALIEVRRFRRRQAGGRPSAALPPITVLKPVHGRDRQLYENLRSFCDQDYPEYQVIFGVLSADDAAIPVINRIIAELPERDITLIVDPAVQGANRKVANLINTFRAAKHDILAVADSDMRVGPDYLAVIAQDFLDPGVGAVTCLYRGVSGSGLPSRLACLHINEWFLPSVLVSGRLQDIRFCFGATMAIRRAILQKAGGFPSLASVLADDYMIGKYAHDQGYHVRLSSYVVDNVVDEPSIGALFRHELRWARTIRMLSPAGYRFLFLTNTISVAIIFLAISALTRDIESIELAVVGLAVALRLWLHHVVTAALEVPSPAPLWMIPLRDVMSFVVWIASFLGRGVQWRGERFSLQRDGRIIAVRKHETA
jgi:ceramide glucosyltransferase